ncbi:MAG: hypothetical protein WC263_00640 [Candidatus Micrarchaeia archaeon]|jgi:hypothetical protein
MGKNEDVRITICTAPPGLYAVVRDNGVASDSDAPHTVQVVTAFKYTYYGNNAGEIFSEPLVYCESKDTNALVDGRFKIEFVGSHENCVLKIKELISLHYAEKTSKKNDV